MNELQHPCVLCFQVDKNLLENRLKASETEKLGLSSRLVKAIESKQLLEEELNMLQQETACQTRNTASVADTHHEEQQHTRQELQILEDERDTMRATMTDMANTCEKQQKDLNASVIKTRELQLQFMEAKHRESEVIVALILTHR